MRIVLSMILVLALAGMTGCSFSDSSGSISDSISSPFKSSSNSSSGDDDDDKAPEPEAPAETASYEADVSQLAVTYAKTGGDIGAFRSAVSQLAKARGLSNWEADPTTNEAIGRGVGTAGMQEKPFTDFSKDLYGDDLNKLNDLRKGYQETAQPVAAS
jgi:hypothetical protein